MHSKEEGKNKWPLQPQASATAFHRSLHSLSLTGSLAEEGSKEKKASRPKATRAEAVGTSGPSDWAMASHERPLQTCDSLEWRRLSIAAQQVASVPLGTPANFIVQTCGEASFINGVVLVRAKSCQVDDVREMADTFLLKLTRTDWIMIKHCQVPLKILQASTVKPDDRSDIILDCTGPQSVVVCQIATTCHETLTVAEVFAGGYQGWSQAAWTMHKLGAPLSMRWGIEKALDTVAMQRFINPHQEEIASISELARVQDSDNFLMLVGDVTDNWWLRVQNVKPANTLAVSAPCQPWSYAGRETGLSSPVGMLMIRMADIASALDISYVMLEQVSGFQAHPHYSVVMSIWSQAGFSVSWKATLDLIHVLPCQRSRHLIVLKRAVDTQAMLPAPFQWKTPHPGSLASTSALFDLPPNMLQQCIPSPDTLNLYLNPAFIPHLRNCQGPSDAEAFRIKEGHQTTSCFLAQYSFGHLLPPDLLQGKGLFGSLVRSHGEVRFFGPPEVASLHGATRPILCHHNRRLSQRLLGNAISIPHAAVTLIQCCHTAGLGLQLRAEDVIQACLQDRLHNDNTVFLPQGQDWLLCPLRECSRYICLVDQPRLQPPSQEDLFRTLELCTSAAKYQLQVAFHVSIKELLLDLQVQHAPVPLQYDTGSEPVCLQVSSLPVLQATRACCQDRSPHKLSFVCTLGAIFVVHSSSPLLPLQLAAIASDAAEEEERPFRLCRPCGALLVALHTLPHLTVLVPEVDEPELFSTTQLSKVGRGCQVQAHPGLVEVLFPASQAFSAWMGIPLGIVSVLGWGTAFSPNPPGDGEDLRVTWRPLPARLRLQEDAFLQVLLHMFLATRAQAVAESPQPGGKSKVVLQMCAETVWQGLLPDNFQVDLLMDWWSELTGHQTTTGSCRLLSGPHVLPAGTTCDGLRSRRQGRGFIRRDGALLLNIHPSLSGGGVKDENKQWCMARFATLCLAQGVDLNTATTFVEATVQAAGVAKVTSFLKLAGDQQQWDAIVQFASSRDIPVPALTNKHARAEARSKKAAQRTRQQQRQITAADVSVEEGFFVNADGSSCTVLESLAPGSSGIHVTDAAQAPELLRALSGIQPDELGILILGHGCPPGTQGCQPLSFPATTGCPPSKILVAGCLHNVGGKKITCRHAAQADIQVSENCCCQFFLHQDEFEPDMWQQITAAPVRAASDIFAQAGHSKPFHAPWARTFQSRGRASTPQLADTVSFHARIDPAEIDQTLRLSGHNRVYALPKTWSRQPHPDYSILWLGPVRADALRASLQVPDQRGLTRNKDKYGLRVCTTVYGKAFAQLHPEQEIPKKLSSLAMNGRSILVLPVQSRTAAPSIVQSGSLPRHSASTAVASAQEEDPFLTNDPWKSYKAQVNGQQVKPIAASPAPRSVTGPTEARFQEQEARIHAIELGLADLKTVGEQRHLEAQQAREEDARTHAASVTELRGQLSSLTADFATQLRTSVEALQGAQNQQLAQVMSSFDEVKQLLSCRDRDPSKRCRVDEGSPP